MVVDVLNGTFSRSDNAVTRDRLASFTLVAPTGRAAALSSRSARRGVVREGRRDGGDERARGELRVEVGDAQFRGGAAGRSIAAQCDHRFDACREERRHPPKLDS